MNKTKIIQIIIEIIFKFLKIMVEAVLLYITIILFKKQEIFIACVFFMIALNNILTTKLKLKEI
jgi:hypothetical protein